MCQEAKIKLIFKLPNEISRLKANNSKIAVLERQNILIWKTLNFVYKEAILDWRNHAIQVNQENDITLNW